MSSANFQPSRSAKDSLGYALFDNGQGVHDLDFLEVDLFREVTVDEARDQSGDRTAL